MKYIKIENSKLFQGDCLDIMKKIPDNYVDCIICDPPFGTTACDWDKTLPFSEVWKEYNRIIKDTGSVLLFSCGIFTPRVMLSNLENYKYRWVWIKRNSTNFVHAKNRPMTKCEDICVFSKAPMGHVSQLGDRRMVYNPQGLEPCNQTIKAGKGRFGTTAGKRPSQQAEFLRENKGFPTDVLFDFPEDAANKKFHTSQKPVKLLEYLIKTYSYENGVILDNCMGSGSTGVACVNTNRKFIGIELEEKYYDISKQRIQEAVELKKGNLTNDKENCV